MTRRDNIIFVNHFYLKLLDFSDPTYLIHEEVKPSKYNKGKIFKILGGNFFLIEIFFKAYLLERGI